MVIEDEEALRECLSQYLMRTGYVVHEASPKTAGAFLESDQTIDMLITDILMPFINGVALARAFLDKFPGILIVFISGYGQEIMEKYPDAPPAVFLHKPFLLTQLGQLVNMMLTLRPICHTRLGPHQPQLVIMPTASANRCGTPAEETDRYLLDKLDDNGQRNFEVHVLACSACAERLRVYSCFLEQLKALFRPGGN